MDAGTLGGARGSPACRPSSSIPPADGVALLTLNRPEKLNAMDVALVTELHAALDEVGGDRDLPGRSCSPARAAGFCAGLDLGGYGAAPDGRAEGPVGAGFATQQHIAALIPRLRSLHQPVIAAVNGAAAGGGLALALGSRRPHRGHVGQVQRGLRPHRAVAAATSG